MTTFRPINIIIVAYTNKITDGTDINLRDIYYLAPHLYIVYHYRVFTLMSLKA